MHNRWRRTNVVENEREGGEMEGDLLWVGKAYSGRISPATDTHVLLMTTQSVAGMQSRPPWKTHPCIRIAPPGRLSVWQPLSTSTSLFIYPAWQSECSMRYMQCLWTLRKRIGILELDNFNRIRKESELQVTILYKKIIREEKQMKKKKK